MIVLDTDVLIDLIDRLEPTFTFVGDLQAAGEVIGTTSINSGEVLRGLTPQGRAAKRFTSMLTAFHEIPFGPAASRRFGALMHAADRSGASLSVMDGLIAATALEAGGRLVTRNARDFSKVPSLQVLVPG